MEHIYFKMTANVRLMVLGIKEVELTPKTKLQIILGTNGSGKSTILRELSPLSSHHEDYVRGYGKKEGKVTHKGSTYEYMSDFTGPKNHYKFIKDEEVIYQGHVADAYNGVVKEHLGITQEIHAICIGSKKFTDMSVSERRNILTKMSPTDFSYAIAYFARLSDSVRDYTGTIRKLGDMLVKEKDKAISENEAIRIRDEVQGLKNSKSDLLKVWAPVNRSVHSILEEIDRTDSAIIDLGNRFTASLKVFSNQEGFKDSREIVSKIAHANSQLTFHENKRQEYFDQVQISREKLADAQAAASHDIKSIDQEIRDITKSIETAMTRVNIHGYSSHKVAKETLVSVMTDLHPILTVLPVDAENKFTHEELTLSREKMLEHSSKSNALEKRLSDVNMIIEAYNHAKDAEHTVCPKCDHKWVQGLDENKYAAAIKEQADLGLILAERRAFEDALRDHIHKTMEVLGQYEYIGKMMRSTQAVLAPLWTHIVSNGLIRRHPNGVVTVLQQASADLEDLIRVDAYQERIRELYAAKDLAERTNGVDVEAIQKANAECEEKVLIHGREAFVAKGRIRVLEGILKEWDFQDQVESNLERLEVTRNYLLDSAEESNKRELIGSIMFGLDQEIQVREQMLTRIDSHSAVIASLEKELSIAIMKEKVLKRAMDALSPKKGLIAKGLTGFINHFLEQQNAIIEKVWLYPLEILPVKVSDEKGVDLDYNFPFMVNGKKAGKDVKGGSGAQGEIFNLSFMLLSMKKSGLDEYPIFLDEFSIKMDVAHRREAMRMIMDLLNTSNFSQIFIVSHYESSYSSLGSADITVLCPDNLNVPPDLAVNVNSRIER